MSRPELPPVTPYVAHTAALTRELIAVLVSTADEAVLASRTAEIATQLGDLAAGRLAPDPQHLHAVAPEDAPAGGEARSPVSVPRPGDRSPVTSLRNPIAPPLQLTHAEPGRLTGRVRLGSAYEGPAGRVHGGIIATMLDHIMGGAANIGAQARSMTGSLTIDYHAGTPLDEDLDVSGWIERTDGRKKHIRGEIRTADGVTARAHGLWITPRAAAEQAPAEARL